MAGRNMPGCNCCGGSPDEDSCCDDVTQDPPATIDFTTASVTGTADTFCFNTCSDLFNVTQTLNINSGACQWDSFPGALTTWPCKQVFGCNPTGLTDTTNARIVTRAGNYILKVQRSLGGGVAASVLWEYDFGATQPDCSTVFSTPVNLTLISYSSWDAGCCDFSAATATVAL